MFIEVFTEEDKNHLLEKGYKLIKSLNMSNCVKHTFLNSNELRFDNGKVNAVYSNSLTF